MDEQPYLKIPLLGCLREIGRRNKHLLEISDNTLGVETRAFRLVDLQGTGVEEDLGAPMVLRPLFCPRGEPLDDLCDAELHIVPLARPIMQAKAKLVAAYVRV